MTVLSNSGVGAILEAVQMHSKVYLEQADTRPVRSNLGVAELRQRLPAVLESKPIDPLSVVQQLAELGEHATLRTVGPRYFGFVNGGALPAALGADLLGVAWDQNAAMAVMSPIAAVTEEVAAGWLLDLFNLPEDACVGFVTGAQGASTTCLAVARHHLLEQQGWDLDKNGLFGAPRITTIVGAERHTTIDVAFRYNGLGQPSKIIAADDQGRMISAELEMALQESAGPIIVCAQAGNVNTGAFDPLSEIASLCKKYKAWLHVDGAFGLWVAASSDYAHLCEGANLADSWAVDGHKWLNVPYDSAYAITAHPKSHLATFGSTASYYVLGGIDAPRDNMNLVPEASRRARGLATWAAIRSLGRRGIDDLVARCCEMARYFATLLAEESGIEILNEVVINQVLVRFGGSDTHTNAIIKAVQEEGTCWAGGSTWQGKAVMRLSVSNWSTRKIDIERSVAAIIKIHQSAIEGRNEKSNI